MAQGKEQLPFLIELLDDENPAVRQKVFEQLKDFGLELEDAISKLKKPLSPEQQEEIKPLLMEHRSQHFREAWDEWKGLPETPLKLQAAYEALAVIFHGRKQAEELSILLDQLAEEYEISHSPEEIDPVSLSRFLFSSSKFKGAGSEEYYQAENSDLLSVLKRKQGIPISLCALYMIIGQRFGMNIYGCHYPNHFLSMVEHKGQQIYVDCFNRARLLSFNELLRCADPKVDRDRICQLLRQKSSPSMMVGRILRNLIASFERHDQKAMAQMFYQTLKDTAEQVFSIKLSE